MTILTSADKEKIKRVIPKSSNKIIDATVVRLYISYPNPDDWKWTGLTGALVLVDDLVGHSFFFKLVDIIGNQGVLWDQELWVDFQYAQDRLYFHSFEIEEYSIGFLFEDKSDAQHFYKRVLNRSKHGSKLTVQNNNAVEAKKKPEQFSNKGYRGENLTTVNEQRMRRAKGILYYDDLPPPEWRSFYRELENMGIGEDMIAENREFIKDYISKTGGPLVGLEPPIPRKYQYQLGNNNNNDSGSLRSRSGTVSSIGSNSTVNRKKKAPPPPPPPPGASAAASISVSSDINNASNPHSSPSPVDSHQSSPFNDIDEVMDESPNSTNIPTRVTSVHRVPPPMTFPNQQQAPLPPQQQQQQQQQQQSVQSFPQLPPRGSMPAANFPPRFNMPGQPPQGQTRGPVPPPPPARGPIPPQSRSNAPPPPPARNGSAPLAPPSRRGNAPPPPPSRHNGSNQSLNGPPQLPPGHPQAYPPSMSPPPQQKQQQQPQQYPTPIPSYEQRQLQQQHSAIPIPPPPPLQQPAATSISPPPPPPPPAMSMGGPPVPPPPPSLSMAGPTASNPAAAIPSVSPGRDQLLASIRSSGLNSLKKVDKSQLDKPSVLLQEAKGETPVPSLGSGAGSGGSAMPGQSGSLADALAAALSSRKNRVAHSDDEDDGDW